MFHVGFALLAFLVPAVLSCGQVERRAGVWEPLVWEDEHLIHVHVVAFGKLFCAYPPDFSNIPSIVYLELGNLGSSYRTLNSTRLHVPAGGKEFALVGEYSYDPRANCLPGKPRVRVEGHCGVKELDDLKPVYKGDLSDKKQRLEVYNLGDVHPVDPLR